MPSDSSALPGRAPHVTVIEDPLAYLPVSALLEFRRGQIVYGDDRPAPGIYLIIEGKVKVSRVAAGGRQVLLDIYQHDEFFGESAFVGPQCGECAVAFENTKLMTWSIPELEEIAMRNPRLGIALMQLLARRSVDFCDRIESFSVDTVAPRLIRGLIRFSERFGTPAKEGSVRIIPLTHEVLSEYVGTSREIVTLFLTRFRRQGYLTYSRDGIFLQPETLKALLSPDANSMPDRWSSAGA
jgi:CRP/FNR family cyclic AMP-dependent transcriptional regulator